MTKTTKTRAKRTALALLVGGLFALVVAIYVSAHRSNDTRPSAPITHPVSVSHTVAAPKAVRVPAPTTAAGYAAMFSRVPVAQWGGADVSASVRLADGRTAWFYGDTFSTVNGFVHSTIITQDGGTLHVSRNGAQALPIVGDNHRAFNWFWNNPTLAADGSVHIDSQAMLATGTCGFCFKDTGITQTARFVFDAVGDAHFTGFIATRHAVQVLPDKFPITLPGKGHIGYNTLTHRDIRLADGHFLVTRCQNWIDSLQLTASGTINFAAYRPIFMESA